ncbi:MAG: DUF393 domain-containing protein [Gammaproteobacteria bacterium]|nr:DUF393 domain-containing protein [Gammaproteobacteria bacterium]
MFYDGGCPLCSREVAHYRRLDRRKTVNWADIHNDPGTVAALGVSYESAMERLHVRDRQGKVHTGAWAFAAVWDELPGYRWLSRALRRLHLLPALDIAYSRFASWRYRRRRCDAGSCAKP